MGDEIRRQRIVDACDYILAREIEGRCGANSTVYQSILATTGGASYLPHLQKTVDDALKEENKAPRSKILENMLNDR